MQYTVSKSNQRHVPSDIPPPTCLRFAEWPSIASFPSRLAMTSDANQSYDWPCHHHGPDPGDWNLDDDVRPSLYDSHHLIAHPTLKRTLVPRELRHQVTGGRRPRGTKRAQPVSCHLNNLKGSYVELSWPRARPEVGHGLAGPAHMMGEKFTASPGRAGAIYFNWSPLPLYV